MIKIQNSRTMFSGILDVVYIRVWQGRPFIDYYYNKYLHGFDNFYDTTSTVQYRVPSYGDIIILIMINSLINL